jgi:hypothetical protein
MLVSSPSTLIVGRGRQPVVLARLVLPAWLKTTHALSAAVNVPAAANLPNPHVVANP